jgi:hypothetical protein
VNTPTTNTPTMNAITAYGLCSGAGEGIRTLDPNLGKRR